MGSVLAIDYGLKHVGIAISDAEKKFAFPLSMIENKSDKYLIEEIKKIVEEKEAEAIVVGLPLNMDKTKSKMTESVENFVTKLKTTISVSIVTIDERLTSFAAEENLRECNISSKKMKKYVDIEAARLILEKYLDELHASST
ncbi:MAG: Holliday junction resolvase RuvX [Candidatus Melainabacteria bacterium]|nr:Holliday junction resolvase RuvX [Candidatus Melainabacteria bacterium]MBI3308217.1 Holliday junction resolvase RuvX [Candidatus Melainabacteria bacterium]